MRPPAGSDEAIAVASLVVRVANAAGQALVEVMAMVIESRRRRGSLASMVDLLEAAGHPQCSWEPV